MKYYLIIVKAYTERGFCVSVHLRQWVQNEVVWVVAQIDCPASGRCVGTTISVVVVVAVYQRCIG